MRLSLTARAGRHLEEWEQRLAVTCGTCKVEPYRYLCHVLTEPPKRSADSDVTDLLPFHFNPDEARLA